MNNYKRLNYVCVYFVVVILVVTTTMFMSDVRISARIDGVSSSINTSMTDIVSKIEYINTIVRGNVVNIAVIQDKINEQEEFVDGFEAEIDSLRSYVDGFESSLIDIENKIQRLDSSDIELSNYIESLQSELNGISSRVSGAESKISSLQTDISNVKKSIAKTAETVATVDGIFVIDTGINQSYTSKVISYYNMLPSGLKISLKNNGWKINITVNGLHVDGVTDRVIALTSVSRKTIFISQYSSNSILHEAGHYLDYINGWYTDTITDEVYQAELPGLLKLAPNIYKGNYSTKIEFFAECFSLYVTNPSGLKNNCPNIYQMIVNGLP